MPAGDSAPAAGHTGPSPGPKFTSRAAVLAVVICAVALSLAYPIREYIAERHQIDQLQALNSQLASQVTRLRAQQHAYTSTTYIEQQAEDQLHMCFPSQRCYTVIYPSRGQARTGHGQSAASWYGVLWRSVREADKVQGK